MPTRRQFIKVGLAGVAFLAAARFLDRPPVALAAAMRVLDERSARVVAALVPVVLAGSIPRAEPHRGVAIREVVEAFDRAVAGMSPAVQAEIDELLGVLRSMPMRYVTTRLTVPVEEAAPEQIARFLARWRTSRFDLLRAGYQALTQLIQAAWYDNPTSWAAIGYPGPPSLAPVVKSFQ